MCTIVCAYFATHMSGSARGNVKCVATEKTLTRFRVGTVGQNNMRTK